MSFESIAGHLLKETDKIVLIANKDSLESTFNMLCHIGIFYTIAGYLDGSIEAWINAKEPV